jgi:hypothetical protein
MSMKIHLGVFAFAAVVASSCIYLACDDSTSAVTEPSPDAGTPGTSSSSGGTSGGTSSSSGGTSSGGTSSSGGDGGPTDCVQNPTTHLEIINACTTATKITKNPTLTKLLPDGGLPPLN